MDPESLGQEGAPHLVENLGRSLCPGCPWNGAPHTRLLWSYFVCKCGFSDVGLSKGGVQPICGDLVFHNECYRINGVFSLFFQSGGEPSPG